MLSDGKFGKLRFLSFFAGMEKVTHNGKSQVQGIEDIPSDDVAKWIKKDIGVALSLLQALYSDADMLRSMAEFLQGRYLNQKEKERNAGSVHS